ncbi:MAG: hypothetical protein KA319_06780, partial [Ferruginibacter sp.]|nr:hypothetical protein [Ferruginibacter sp.]
SLPFKDYKEKPYKTESGNYMQLNLGINIPYSSNLTIRASGLVNQRNALLGVRNIDTSNSISNEKFYMSFKTINVGADVCLLYTKYLKHNKQLFFGLGYFTNYGLGGKIKATLVDSTFKETVLFVLKKPKEIYSEFETALLSRKNSGIIFKAGYKTRRNFYYSLFFNLGVENIRADKLTKFSSMRTNEGGISIGYFIKNN